MLLLLLFNLLFHHRNVNSFLIYFIIFFLLHVRMAEEPPNGELCNKVHCMYVCTCTSNWFFLKPTWRNLQSFEWKSVQKGEFFEPDKFQKRKEKKKEQGRKEKKRKSNFALLVFIMATLEILFAEKRQFHPKVHLAVTFSKIQLDIRHLHIFHNAP